MQLTNLCPKHSLGLQGQKLLKKGSDVGMHAAHWCTKHRNKLHVGMLLTCLQSTETSACRNGIIEAV